MPNSQTTIELPAPTLVVACDTCGTLLQVFMEENTAKNPGADWILSVCRCDVCDHRRDVESYRRGWEDAKKYYPNLLNKALAKEVDNE